MKKNYLSLLAMVMMMAMVCVGFTSCSDDDDDKGVEVTEANLIGTWQLVEMGWYDAEDDESDHKDMRTHHVYERFYENGAGVTYEYDDEDERWYIDSYSYSLIGNTLTMWGDAWNVETFTNKTLVLRLETKFNGGWEMRKYERVSDSVIKDAE